jgi:hypothetical protein
MIPFTRRELTRAWRQAYDASRVTPPSNAHRLLMFYAAECGLKASYLKQRNVEILDSTIASELMHDLNRVMDRLFIGATYHLPNSLSLNAITQNGNQIARNCECRELNQVWRYGGRLTLPNDDVRIEHALNEVNKWILKELG